MSNVFAAVKLKSNKIKQHCENCNYFNVLFKRMLNSPQTRVVIRVVS